jgi:hypothetical protein
MHGCRQCDWDACEDCTDRFETGLVKCTALQDLSGHCLRLLENCGSEGETHDVKELQFIVVRMCERHESSLADLARLLNQNGGAEVSVHQFINNILPALHAAVVQTEEVVSKKERKVKKAKVDGNALIRQDDRSGHYAFLEKALKLLVEQNETDRRTAPRTTLAAASMKSEADNKSVIEPKPNISFCPGASEILRRLHQVLSFRENSDEHLSSGKASKSDDLQSLKKPLVLHLVPFPPGASDQAGMKAVVHAEPLITMSMLQDQVLRSHRCLDPEYRAFCQR